MLKGEGLSGRVNTEAHPTLTPMAQGAPVLGTFVIDMEMLNTEMEDYLEVGDLRHGLG